MHTILCWKHVLFIQSWSSWAVHLIYYQSQGRCLSRDLSNFSSIFFNTVNTLQDFFLDLQINSTQSETRQCCSFFFLCDLFLGRRQRICCSMVVWDGLMSDDRRNVSGSTGRIPQSFATRSLHWQESATYFSMATASFTFFFLHSCFFCFTLKSVLPSPLPFFWISFFLFCSLSLLLSLWCLF